jgi:hypothetical protein
VRSLSADDCTLPGTWRFACLHGARRWPRRPLRWSDGRQVGGTDSSHATRHTSHVTRHTSHVTRHTPHVTRHTSHVTRHTSHVTRHTSHVTRHTSHVTMTRHLRQLAPHPLWPASLQPLQSNERWWWRRRWWRWKCWRRRRRRRR